MFDSVWVALPSTFALYWALQMWSDCTPIQAISLALKVSSVGSESLVYFMRSMKYGAARSFSSVSHDMAAAFGTFVELFFTAVRAVAELPSGSPAASSQVATAASVAVFAAG